VLTLENTLYVLETVQQTFIQLELCGEKTLKAYDIEEYYNAQKFDNEQEVKDFEELINTGKSSNPTIRPDWKITIDSSLLPVQKRILITQLKEV
jgi:hypothetical protein